mmetsp:Transcript_29958/g.53161  ORF Transcript_29958/g.53161 Transcript_29958/m.53161 type:complete len:650 (+) Transcript_29958:31-1980(+)
MTNYLTTLQVYSYTILGLFSFVSALAIIFAYLLLRSLRVPPGMIIMMQCIGVAIVDLQWALAAIHYVATGSLEDSLSCQAQGLLTVFFVYQSWNYTTCLACEIYLKLNRPLVGRYTRRDKLYHAISNIAAFAIATLVGVTDAAGLSPNGTCFIKSGSWAEALGFLSLVYLVTSCYIALDCIVRMSYAGVGAGILKRYSWFVVAFSMIMLPSVLDYVILVIFSIPNTPYLEEVSIVLKSAGGLILSSIRLTDPILISEFKRTFAGRRRSTLEPLLNDPSDLSGHEIEKPQDFIYNWFFQDVISETLQSTLSSICLSLKHLMSSESSIKFDNLIAWNLFYYKQTNTWDISPEDVKDLSPQYAQCLTEPVRIVEYAPAIFAHLRHLDQISNDELVQSLSPSRNKASLTSNLVNSQGAPMFYSYDHKFVIKVVSTEQRKTMVSTLLHKWHTYVSVSSFNKSIIARILGVYTIKLSSRASFDIILMQNLLPPEMNVHAVFDMTGNRFERPTLVDSSVQSILDLPKGKVYNYADFAHFKQTIDIPFKDQLYLKHIVKGDVEILKTLNITKYSLFVAVGELTTPRHALPKQYERHVHMKSDGSSLCYIIGIIGFLQVAGKLKTVSPYSTPLNISRQSQNYGEQFLNFLDDIMKVEL